MIQGETIRQGAAVVVAAAGALALRRYASRTRRMHPVVAEFPSVVAWNASIAQSMTVLCGIVDDDEKTRTLMQQLEALRCLDMLTTHAALRDMTHGIARFEERIKDVTKISMDMASSKMNDYVYLNDDVVPAICEQLSDVVLHNHLLGGRSL